MISRDRFHDIANDMGCNRRKRRWRLVLGFGIGWHWKSKREQLGTHTQELDRVGRPSHGLKGPVALGQTRPRTLHLP